MLASELFKLVEHRVPLKLALDDDKVGFIGPGYSDEIEVGKVAVILDVIPENLNRLEADLIVCHHPPLFLPSTPTYIIHSNWDIFQGGANDALAESLKLKVSGVLDEKTGIGRICTTKCSFSLDDFIETVFQSIDVDNIRIVKGNKSIIEKVAVISGFGLNPYHIKLASKKGVDLLLSGDLTHPGSILAQKLGITLIDATHQGTEVPGLIKLCSLLNEMGVKASVEYAKNPWETYSSTKNSFMGQSIV